MSLRDLPQRAHLDHLRNEAKALHRAFRARDASAIQRIRDVLGDAASTSSIKLTDAHRVIAREYGFATWARLRAYVVASRGFDDAVIAFLTAVESQDADAANRMLHAQPRIARDSLHVAAVLGSVDGARRLIAEDPSRVSVRAGDSPAEPLLFLCYSPFHGESAERDAGLPATARLLLDAGADPNTTDGRYSVPALYAVTGARSVLPIARLLLDAGADPTDGESVFHAAERFHEDALELLFAAGAELNRVGDWGNTALYFLLRWHDIEREPRVRQGLVWLLDHSANCNLPCGKEQENALHVSARLGQSVSTVSLLLEHGANVNARRGDGATAWRLASRGGFDEVAMMLERAGADPQPLLPVDELLAACGRGDIAAARRLTSVALMASLDPSDRLHMMEAAAAGRDTTVLACLAAGFDVGTLDAMGATTLHHAAIHGRAPVVRALLAAGGDITVRDSEHHATPLGWATFGADHVADAEGDYAATVRALFDAGARRKEEEYWPQHAGVRAVLTSSGHRAPRTI